jgi:MFS transporter, YNFM family, putative membrane transport protein
MIEQGSKQYWRATLALSLGSFLVFALLYLTQPLLPIFRKEFGLSPAASSLSLSIVTFMISVSLLLYGPISDSVGRRSIMIFSMLGAMITTLGIVFTSDYTTLVIMRGLQGVCLGGLPSLAMAYMSEEFSPKALSLALGLYISANSLGGMSGRLISGVAADLWGWKASFLVVGLLSILFFLMFVWLLPPSQRFQKTPFRLREAWKPMLHHLRNPALNLAFLTGGLNFFVFVGFFNFITFLLSDEPYRLSPTVVGLLFLSYLAGTVSSTVSGKLAQKWGKSTCLLIGISVYAVGILFTLGHHLLLILIGLLIVCFGFFFAHSAATGWVNGNATFARASASSLYLVSYYLGGSLGSFYLGFFWNHWHWSGIVFGSILILCVTAFCSFKLRRIELSRHQSSSAFYELHANLTKKSS